MITIKQLTSDELFELYIETLSSCDNNLIYKSDLEIEDSIFDIFFGGIISYFYKDSLERLKHDGLIDQEIEEKSLELRSLVIKLRETDYWDITAFRNVIGGWKELVAACEALKKLLQGRWSKEELEYWHGKK